MFSTFNFIFCKETSVCKFGDTEEGVGDLDDLMSGAGAGLSLFWGDDCYRNNAFVFWFISTLVSTILSLSFILIKSISLFLWTGFLTAETCFLFGKTDSDVWYWAPETFWVVA